MTTEIDKKLDAEEAEVFADVALCQRAAELIDTAIIRFQNARSYERSLLGAGSEREWRRVGGHDAASEHDRAGRNVAVLRALAIGRVERRGWDGWVLRPEAEAAIAWASTP